MTNALDPFAIIRRHQTHAPVEVRKIAYDLGIFVYVLNMDDNISGKLIRDPAMGGDSGFAIEVNKRHHANRQRFTMAHEVAHFVLHRDLIEHGIVDNAMYRSGMLDHYEAQANRLAADILMPVQLLQSAHEENPDVASLARQFCVSEAAMRIRVESLGLISGQSQPSLL